MRVYNLKRRSLAVSHMGMCQPGHATWYPAAYFIWVHAGDPKRVLILVSSNFNVLLPICAMALQMTGASVTFLQSFEAAEPSAATLEHSLVLWGIAQGHSHKLSNAEGAYENEQSTGRLSGTSFSLEDHNFSFFLCGGNI